MRIIRESESKRGKEKKGVMNALDLEGVNEQQE